MGYGFYQSAGRPAGYLVLATCDKRGCDEEIDRGLAYLCGDHPHETYSNERGCGRYFCYAHLGYVGGRGGCHHRRWRRAWGETLSCMEVSGLIHCLYRRGHAGLHAWAGQDTE